MTHRYRIAGAAVTLAVVALLFLVPGCSNEETPLPEVEGVTAVLGTATTDNPDGGNTIVVSWNAVADDRADGYAIYRAEQGTGAAAEEKSEFTVQAVTFATKYVDDDVHASVAHPTVRYFYQIAVLTKEGKLGPMSPEVSIDYSTVS